jgi:hypothetical protein
MLPAGMIRDIDLDTETIFVDLTKDEIKNALEFDENSYRITATGTSSTRTTGRVSRHVPGERI